MSPALLKQGNSPESATKSEIQLSTSKITRQDVALSHSEAIQILKGAAACLEGLQSAQDLFALAKERKVTFEPRHKVDPEDTLLAQMVHNSRDVIRFDMDDMGEYLKLLERKGMSTDAAKNTLSIRLAPLIGHELAHMKTLLELEAKDSSFPHGIRDEELSSSLREASIYRELKAAHPAAFSVPLTSPDKIKPLAADGGQLEAKISVFCQTRLKDAGPDLKDVKPELELEKVVKAQAAVDDVINARKELWVAIAPLKEDAAPCAFVHAILKSDTNVNGDDATLGQIQFQISRTIETLKNPSKFAAVKEYYEKRLSLEKSILLSTPPTCP